MKVMHSHTKVYIYNIYIHIYIYIYIYMCVCIYILYILYIYIYISNLFIYLFILLLVLCTSFCNYSSYNNNHSQSFPIYRYFSHAFQAIPCYPTPQKPSLDNDTLNNYRPISNLSLISKITERKVKSRLNEHFSSNFLYKPNQSAYTKYHSTETTLLFLHDHLITAISHQQVSCLCLLDLSAAFDTLNSPPSSLILVRYCRLCPYMVQNILKISLFLFLSLVLHHLPIPFPVAYPKALSLALSFSTCTPHHSALSSQPGH